MAQTKYQIFKNEDAVKYLTDEQKAQICTFDLKNIFRTLEEGWVAFGQRCEEELHRPELSDICTQIGYVPFSDLRASELER